MQLLCQSVQDPIAETSKICSFPGGILATCLPHVNDLVSTKFCDIVGSGRLQPTSIGPGPNQVWPLCNNRKSFPPFNLLGPPRGINNFHMVKKTQ